MIGDRQYAATDVGAIWFGHGATLAHQIDELAADLAAELPAPHGELVAERIRELLYDPQPTQPPLGEPPTLRPAVPGWRPQPRRAASDPGA